MGGEQSEPLISFEEASDGMILCKASLGSVVEARECDSESVDDGKSHCSSLPPTRLTDKVHSLLLCESWKNGGIMETRIRLQYEKLCEGSSESLEDMRVKIKRYRPGDGVYEVGGVTCASFAIPKVTTLLIVGPSGVGKSSLINNMIRVCNNVTIGFDRTQTHGEPGMGSLFLQEYFVCEEAKQFCVYDSRGFSNNGNVAEDLGIIKEWMTNGISHGETVFRPSDSRKTKEECEGRGRQGHAKWTIKRRVDFVIFVVDAFSVHSMRESHDVQGLQNLLMLYKSPFLTFKDDRPAVVMTHGDKLPPKDRITTRMFIGELFGVSPLDQVFDISCFTERSVHPGDVDTVNDLVMMKMLEFCLERADRNLPYKATTALRLRKMQGLLVNRWKQLDTRQQVLLIMNAVLFLCVLFFFLTRFAIHGWRSMPIFRKMAKRHLWMGYKYHF